MCSSLCLRLLIEIDDPKDDCLAVFCLVCGEDEEHQHYSKTCRLLQEYSTKHYPPWWTTLAVKLQHVIPEKLLCSLKKLLDKLDGLCVNLRVVPHVWAGGQY